MVFIKVDKNGRLTAVANPGFHCGDGEIGVELTEEITGAAHDYVLQDGVLIYDPLPQEEEPSDTLNDRLSVLEKENAQLKEALDLLLSGEVE